MDFTNLADLFTKLTDEQKAKIKEWADALSEAKKHPWKPTDGAQIFHLNASGEVTPTFFIDGDDEDNNTYEQGNSFETQAEAEFEATRRKCLATYERLSIEAGELNNPWDGNSFHYVAFYDNGIRVGGFTNTRDMNIHFPSEETCRNAVETIGEGNFKKYILKIEE